MKAYQRDGPLEITRGGEGRVNNIAKETGQKKYKYPVGGCEFLKPQKKIRQASRPFKNIPATFISYIRSNDF